MKVEPIFLHPLAPFAFLLKQYPTKKQCKKGSSELMSCFNNNMFSKSNKKERKKGISEVMAHFSNNAFLESNEKKHGKYISELMSHSTTTHFQNPMKRYNASLESISKNDIVFKNNIVVFKNNSIGLPNINVVPFLAFHHLHFLFFHSSQVASRV